MTQTPSPLLTQVQNEKLVGNYSLKTFYIHNVGLSMLSLFLQMLQLNLESQMTHEGSQTPTATDVHQPALLEKNPAWVQTQYHGMLWIIPHSRAAEHTLQSTQGSPLAVFCAAQWLHTPKRPSRGCRAPRCREAG